MEPKLKTLGSGAKTDQDLHVGIPTIIESIVKAISQVDNELICLRERLLPIMKQCEDNKEGVDPSVGHAYSSSLAIILIEQKVRLDGIMGTIAKINTSVEL